MKKSPLLILLVMSLFVMFSSIAYAQGPTHVYCGSLAEEDCDILLDSQEVMQSLSSGQAETQMTIFIGNIPEAPISDISMAIASQSQFSINPDGAEAIAELQEIQSLTSEEILQDMDEILELLPSIYESTNSATDMTIAISEDVVDLMAADSGLDIPATFTINMDLVGGVLYVNLNELMAVTPETAGLEGWFGLDMVEFLQMTLEQASMDSDGAAAMQANQMSASMMMGMSMNNSEEMEPFIEAERLADDSYDGQDVAVFQFTFDFAGFLASDTFREMVITQMELSGDPTLDPAEAEEAFMMIGLVAPMLTTGVTAESFQVVGLDDAYLHRSETYFDWDLSSLAMLASLSGEDTGLDPDNAPIIQFEAITDNFGFDEAVDIEAPTNAIIIPTEIVIEAMAEAQ